VHVLQHVPFEDPGSISQWLEYRKATIGYTRFFESPQLPPLNSIDMVVIMGGPMSANDEGKLPWLIREKQFIHDAIIGGISVLGICLGAQLIASAMGARVYRNSVKEIGWFPVRSVPAPAACFSFPEECVAFHWHGETFDLPPGAVRLAGSEACVNQAFQINRNVLGMQFHLETTPASAAALIENCRDELVPGPHIQSEADLRHAPDSRYRKVNALMNDVLSYLVLQQSCATLAITE